MELLTKASKEARQMYQSVVDQNMSMTDDIRKITKRVAESDDLDMYLCMGPHIQQILNWTKVVSGKEFLTAFKHAVGELEGKFDGEKWFAVTNHDGILPQYAFEGMEKHGLKVHDPEDRTQCNKKSGFFFLLLALSLSEKLRSSLAGIVCTPTQFEMDCSGINTKVVMFDDMSYTGMQASATLRQFRGADVYFVCPYIGSGAWEELIGNKINVMYTEKVKTYGEMISNNGERGAMMDTCSYKMDAYPVWFYHKIADNVSSFPEVYKYVVEKDILPPYKDENLFPTYAKLVKKLSKSFVFDCNNVPDETSL